MKNITKKIRKPNTVLFAVLLTQPVNFSLANLFEKKYPNQMMGHYEIEKQENPDVIRMRLLTENNQKTNIFFDLMKENGLPWDSTLVDNEFEIAVPARIFRTPYFAHLEHYKSLESQFYRLMRPLFDVNKNAQFPKAVIWDSSNNPQFPGIDDSLDAFIKSITSEKKELTPGKDAALHFYKKVEQLVAKSRSQLSAKITKAKTEDQKNLLNWLAKSSLAKLVDKTEAIYVTDEEKKSKKLLHDFSQISAFNLSPLKILLKWPDQTFRALIAAAEQDTFNPLLWLYANDGHDKKIKLHLMKLLTHNHRAEGLFIQMLYLTSNESNIRDRVIKCYEAYAAINRLYQLEQEFWDSGAVQIHSKKIDKETSRKITKNFGIDFLQKRSNQVVKLKLPNGAVTPAIPRAFSYHFYGAYALAMTLRLEFKNWIRPILPSILKAAGKAYKTQTNKNKDSKKALETANFIASLYEEAGKIAAQ